MRFFVFLILGLFAFNAFGAQVLHVSDTCKKEYIEDLHTLNTKDASLYAYYHYIASGGCLDVDLKDEGRFDRINQHFSKLGNYSAYTEVHSDYSQIVDKAKQGDIDARAILITANAVQKTAHYSRSPKLDALNLSDLDKQRYVAEILDLADQGDVRTLKSALVYYLWQPTKLSANYEQGVKAQDRIKRANQLLNNYGEQYAWLIMLHNQWLLGAKDIRWCALKDIQKTYLSEFHKSLDDFSRGYLCMNTFNGQEFERIGSMSKVERLEHLRATLTEYPADMPDDKNKLKVWLNDWDKQLNLLGYHVFYETPLSKEVLSYLLYSLPYGPNRKLQGFYWLTDENPSRLMRLISSTMGNNIYDPTKNFDEQGIASIASSTKLFAYSLLYAEKFNEYYDVALKKVLPMGDLTTLYTFYLLFTLDSYKHETRAWSAIEALEVHEPEIASSLKKNYLNKGFKQPDKQAVNKVLESWEPYLPSYGEGVFVRTNLAENVIPYTTAELTKMIESLKSIN
ncbi:hypothetical protein [Vibrio penaeicida]|uniref:hypothetical protein n=1 Tax=Vibrio penaeicida TaxID=104609 RepID=UPI000CEA561B|nr:hypothetical protein [Vibrio penaeicida]